jgi:hypothetical protein
LRQRVVRLSLNFLKPKSLEFANSIRTINESRE